MGSSISVEIIKDSIAPSGVRLTTFVLSYPRFIHAEFMTHRVFSRNASSSRAIPVKRRLKMIQSNPAGPVEWGLDQKGMQAYSQATGLREKTAKWVWRAACWTACFWAKVMLKLNIHKQIVNRLVEPFSDITVVVTSNDFNNFIF